MPILSRQAHKKGGRPLYVDAFAGPGEYADSSHGSPLVATFAATDHALAFPVPIEMVFIEKRPDRHQHLMGILDRTFAARARNAIVKPPILGDADTEVRRILERRDPRIYTPTLVFLDQFGYSFVSMDLIRSIMGTGAPSCEAFWFMNWQRSNPYMGDRTKWPAFDRAFGGSEWREVVDMPYGRARATRFLQIYEESLRLRAGINYSWTFAMHGAGDELLYWLTFCSNSDRGLEEMKSAMWRVDPSGHFQFSDKHSRQWRLFGNYDERWLAQHLQESFRNTTKNLSEIRHFVLTQTPCYNYNKALRLLEREAAISITGGPPGRKRGTFKRVDEAATVVRFHADRREQGKLF